MVWNCVLPVCGGQLNAEQLHVGISYGEQIAYVVLHRDCKQSAR